jgi:hypothetical protein
MNNILRRIGLSWIALATMISPAVVHGRDWDAAADLYGRGVHAYFAGGSTEAEALLSRALVINPHDPRLFYFRALSRLRLGRTDEARADMKDGAALEAERFNRYPIGAALQRVQGSDRLLLEQFRQQARAKAAMEGDRQVRARIQQITGHESNVLREKVVVPLEELLRPGGPRSLTADELAQRAAFAEPIGAAIKPAERPVPRPASSEVEPFDDAAPQPAVVTPTPVPASSATPETPPESEDDPFSVFE